MGVCVDWAWHPLPVVDSSSTDNRTSAHRLLQRHIATKPVYLLSSHLSSTHHQLILTLHHHTITPSYHHNSLTITAHCHLVSLGSSHFTSALELLSFYLLLYTGDRMFNILLLYHNININSSAVLCMGHISHCTYATKLTIFCSHWH